MAMAYLTSWRPVLEEDDPYGDGISPEGLTAVKHVQEIQILEGKNYDRIKEMVFRYGGVQSSLYMPLSNPSSNSGLLQCTKVCLLLYWHREAQS